MARFSGYPVHWPVLGHKFGAVKVRTAVRSQKCAIRRRRNRSPSSQIVGYETAPGNTPTLYLANTLGQYRGEAIYANGREAQNEDEASIMPLRSMGLRERSLTEEMTSKDVSGGQSHHWGVRVHHWVLWWFFVGVACAVVAVVNILFRKLTPAQETMILILAVWHWCLGGLVCWALEGIRVEKKASPRKLASPVIMARDREWHSASEFRLPGTGKALLPFPYKHGTRETLAHYGLRDKGR